jgi:RNA recognition motif-containing protein
MNIYVGNLSRDVTDEELRKEFEVFGKVESVNVIKDKYSGQSRGFGFVEMAAKAEAQAAITGLKGKVMNGRTIDVSEARPRTEGGGRGGGGRGGFGGGGRGGGFGGGGGGGRRRSF